MARRHEAVTALAGQPLGLGGDDRRSKAYGGPPQRELAADVVIVDAPEGWVGIVAELELNFSGGVFIGEPCRELHRHSAVRGQIRGVAGVLLLVSGLSVC